MGAPTAESGQPDVEKPGAVFKCRPDSPGSCDIIPFDTTGKGENTVWLPMDRGTVTIRTYTIYFEVAGHPLVANLYCYFIIKPSLFGKKRRNKTLKLFWF